MPSLDERSRTQSTLRLIVTSIEGSTQITDLCPDSTLIVGSGQSCGLQLTDPGVSTIHGIFRLESDRLWLQPWNANAVMYVNGEPVGDDLPLVSGDEVRIGTHRIVVDNPLDSQPADLPMTPHHERPSAATTPADLQVATPSQSDPLSPRVNPAPSSPDAAEEMRATDTRPPSVGRPSPLQSHRAGGGEGPWECAPGQNDAVPFPTQYEMCAEDISVSYGEGGFEQETIDLLQAEISMLQSELAERDSQLSEWASRSSCSEEDLFTPVDLEDTVSAARLEQSLGELDQADQRIAELEQLLRLAEEARSTDRQERQQIEAWVGDIEGRLEQWMTERRAETDLLQNQLEQSKAECSRLREQIHVRAREAGETDSAERMQLQHQYAELQEAFRRIESERDQLREQMQQAEGECDDRRRQADRDTTLREERLQLAHERATLARERAELETARTTLDEVAPQAVPSQDVDRRVRAFREHLRELHEEKQPEQPGRGLGSRLAQLWRRLDGNRSG